MKTLILLLSLFIALGFIGNVYGQDLLEKEADKQVEKGFESLFGKKKKKTQKSVQPQTEQVTATEQETQPAQPEEESALKAWSKFDFVPGDEVIFEDNLEDEENGEFPSKWDLQYGNVEIAKYGDDFVINFPTNNNSYIVPLMSSNYEDYLPDQFTVEFDVYMSEFCTPYFVKLYDMINQESGNPSVEITIKPKYVSVTGFGSSNLDYPNYPYWKHVAIAFNIRSLKIYYDQERVANIPNLRTNPTGITLSGSQCHVGSQAMIRNIRIAKGGKKLYDRVTTEGKIIANGIRFETGKAQLKPESMGVINKISKLMGEHPEINFSVEGHTDNVGDEAVNQKLSEDRADAVMKELIEMGVSKDRLSANGWGETKPLKDNGTPEGRANNRRVEFVKIN